MKAHEFYAKVRERGGYDDAAEAQRVTAATLALLGQRLVGGEAKDLAAQLPPELQPPLLDADGPAERFGVTEFLSRAAEALGTSEEAAKWDVSAVLTTVGEAVTGGQLNQILTQLQPGYAELFGKPDLA
ncbi:DUF2267 domain-containing protein [Blastococcus sp. CT_GayMR20]|uniref:DUF2267 domain-containing protein n=1 Tax=Blastococcus sp. CT_GayMR20 TaxID=2559609 RepID=UPI001073A560|nr:DUF2267 domain-containing protein [Blastococcus sp. CT_GayMR20]TFV87108.1 DUF2267 domain-containing protein [Blastococcus sp. CT_GayMR20]